MKVLAVTNMYPVSGRIHAGTFVKSQMDSIAAQGVEVEIISMDHRLGILKYAAAWWNVFTRSFDSSFDLIHAHYGYSGMISCLQWKLPVLVSFCGGDVLGNPNRKGKVQLLSKLFLPLSWLLSMAVPGVIVKSEEMKRKLPKKNNVFIIPNGVDFEKFSPQNRKNAQKQCGLHSTRQYVLFPSNPAWIRKAYPLAREAVEILRRRGANVELVVLNGNPHDMVPVYMNACDVMVLTSMWEGSPNVVKEAMACNVPVVTVTAGDAADVVRGCSGCYVARRTAEDVADKLARALEHTGRTKGREHIAHLEESIIARRIITIYRKIQRSSHEQN